MLFFIFSGVHAFGQSSVTAQIEVLLKRNNSENITVIKTGAVIAIKRNNSGNESDDYIPYADVSYNCVSSSKNGKDTLYEVWMKNRHNTPSISIWERDKETKVKAIGISFHIKQDAYTFIRLMQSLDGTKPLESTNGK